MQEIARQVALIKSIRGTVSKGKFTRLVSPQDSNFAAWQFVDSERIILCAYRVLSRAMAAPSYVQLKDVRDGLYEDEDGAMHSAADLMHAGVRCDFPMSDFASVVRIWNKKS